MRQKCESFQQVDIRKIDFTLHNRWQYPKPDKIAVCVSGDSIRVVHGRADFVVTVDRTPCNYGGARSWFLCPQCGDRRAVLYDGGDLQFGCRGCMDLWHSSLTEDPLDRFCRKRRKLCAKLGIDGDKPKSMHLSTYEQVHADIALVDLRSATWVMRRLTGR